MRFMGRIVPAILAVFVLPAFIGCSAPKKDLKDYKRVEITNCQPGSGQDPVPISDSDGEEVQWISLDGKIYDITFKISSPFKNPVSPVGPAAVNSGPLTKLTAAKCSLFGGTAICKYGYTIKSKSGAGCENDPIVIVTR